MKKIISVICAVVLLISAVSVSAFALTKSEADENVAVQKELFESALCKDITAGDARDVLLTSAGLSSKELDTRFFDIDEDGKITAIDARIFLRIAAKLDNINNYYGEVVYDYFLALINSIKPGASKYYSSTIDETKQINYKDPDNVVGQLNDQVKNLENILEILATLLPNEDFSDVDLSETENFDFAKTIKESEGKKNYSYKMSNTQILTNNDYPVIGDELACLLTFNEIKSVKYETNQTFTFERISSLTNQAMYTESVAGLDAITVYLKDESVSLTGNLSGRFDNLTVNKAFNALSEDEVKKLLEENTSAGDLGDLEGMEELGTLELKIEPKTLQYKGSYIKIYFDPESGVPVGTVHSLGYAMNMKMSTVVDISLAGIKIFNVKGAMDIENVLNTETKVYLYETNPNHTRW